MSTIRILPDALVNKIAAGEVVERPASVLKELVENALDAGATRIAVSLEDGGKQLVRVTDDGEGMTADEVRLAIAPHATSKLACEEDLYTIVSMGFRGEALASIGAVSNMRIVSRKRGSVEGHQIIVSGEEVQASTSAGCPEGTTVEVRDLFFNVPARRKFLRTRATETGHANEQFARLALGFPEVGFDLTNHGRVVHNLPAGCAVRERIGGLYGAELAGELIPIERDERGLNIEAYAAPPIRSRSTTSWQYVFVNGRCVRDRFVQHAVREAYRGLMEHDRQPVYFVFLTVAPDAVDVNVHPTKSEVRWRESNLIHSQVLSAFRETFLQTDLTPALRTTRPGDGAPVNANVVRREMADMLRSSEPIVGDSAPPAYGNAAPPDTPHSAITPGAPGPGRPAFGAGPAELGTRNSELATRNSELATRHGEELWRAMYADAPESSRGPLTADVRGGLGPVRRLEPGPDAARQRPAIQLHNTYLVVEADDGMLIIDQHALHERILYNQFCERITAGPLEGQRLLLPETLAVTPKQMALLQENETLLHRLGIEVTMFGTDSVAVQCLPALLKDTDAVPFMRDLLDKLEDPAPATQRSALSTQDSPLNTETEKVIHQILDMMACKAAVKAGDRLTPQEIDALVAQRDLVEKSSNCPHGRPTTLRLTVSDLERQFKRK